MASPPDHFVSSVSHDLKDPLEAIVMGASLLLRTLPDDQSSARTIADAILRSAQRVSRTVDDLRDLARLDAGSMQLQLEELGAEAVALEAAGARMEDARRRRVSVDLLVGPGLRVRVDRAQFARAIGKLIDAAVRFSEPGGRVTIDVERAGGRVEFKVTDGGRGIPADVRESLFDRSQPDAPRAAGPGLSLLLAKRLVELHGGEITLQSVPGRGTTFCATAALA